MPYSLKIAASSSDTAFPLLRLQASWWSFSINRAIFVNFLPCFRQRSMKIWWSSFDRLRLARLTSWLLCWSSWSTCSSNFLIFVEIAKSQTFFLVLYFILLPISGQSFPCSRWRLTRSLTSNLTHFTRLMLLVKNSSWPSSPCFMKSSIGSSNWFLLSI